MRGNLAFVGLGIGFVLMGAALFALTLRKKKSAPANPNKTQQREAAALVEENKKMRIAAGVIAAFGVVLLLLS
jgi:hypothetical protein